MQVKMTLGMEWKAEYTNVRGSSRERGGEGKGNEGLKLELHGEDFCKRLWLTVTWWMRRAEELKILDEEQTFLYTSVRRIVPIDGEVLHLLHRDIE
jgi:hypothetical protein